MPSSPPLEQVDGVTPLDQARLFGQDLTAQLLLSAGAEANTHATGGFLWPGDPVLRGLMASRSYVNRGMEVLSV